MASFSVQFHATPTELVAFARQWLLAHGVHCAALKYFPFSGSLVDAETVGREIEAGARCLVFGEHPIALDVRGNMELADRNPGLLVLDLGRLSERGLEESHLSTMDATPTWKAIARALKRATRAGATAVNEELGATAPARAHRYTEGAHDLWKAGTKMVTITGVMLRLEKSW